MQDGDLPPEKDPQRHEDSVTYRFGAVRECFEESGILLARDSSRRLLRLSSHEQERARHAIHDEKFTFDSWLKAMGAQADLAGLIPFTRWLTPASVMGRRYSTQMYLYFLPLDSHTDVPNEVHIPTADGGVEHTAAEFLPVAEWLSRYRAEDIILYPPQFFLLSIIAPFLDPVPDAKDRGALQAQRDNLLHFCRLREDGEPSWAEKCISPHPIWKDGRRVFMALDNPGPELAGAGRRGDGKRIMNWVFQDGRQQILEVRWKQDVVKEKECISVDVAQACNKEGMEEESLQGEKVGKERL